MFLPRFARSIGWLVVPLLLVACSNGRGSLQDDAPPNAPAEGTYSIGGTIAGLTGSGLILQNNGTADLQIAGDGPFTFPGGLASGAAYNVTVLTQPSGPPQTCSVANGTGTVASANVSNIEISCSTTPRFSVGGAVSGLAGSGLVLQNNAGDDLAISADGAFTFATPLENEASYSVIVRTQPTGQNCVVQNATGAIASANVTDVQVSCAANQFAVTGSVSGLSGTGLVLRLNGGNDLAVVSEGPFAFPAALSNGASYEVSIHAQPRNPSQECTLANASGAIAGANVTNIAVTCATRSFTVGGSVTGLAASGLALRVNGAQDLPIMGNGSFTFPTPILSGTSYTVTILMQPAGPPLQTCTVTNASGVVRDQNITSVTVTCATQTFTVGGTVSGLLGSGLRLRNSNGESIAVGANGPFSFPTKVASGGAYNITVETAPANPTQACTITNGTGTIVDRDMLNIEVSCSTSNFTIGGTAHNLLGSGLILRNNGGDDLAPTTSGPFAFATAIPSGATYNVTVAQQPTAPSQTCVVENPSGTVGGGPVTNVQVRCTTNGFLVGGQVSGLLGSGLQLQNGTDTITIAADGPFRFPTALQAGAPYYVHVLTMPSSPAQACFVLNATGTIQGQDITNVEIRCVVAAPM